MYNFWKILAVMAITANVLPMMASLAMETLSASEGQSLVERFFAGQEFNTGDWGNDISFLLPFKWASNAAGGFTLFSMAEHVQTREAHWIPAQIVDGQLKHCSYEWTPERSIDFLPGDLYELKFSESEGKLLYHNEQTCRIEHSTGDVIRLFTSSVWYELDLETNGIPRKTIHDSWPEGIFADKAVKSLRIVMPHRFRGPKAKPVKEKDRMETRLDEYEATQSGWHMDEKTMEALANLHRKYVAEAFPSNDVDSVFIVVCDANHDGKGDAYVSSDAEKAEADKYRWSLYLGDGHVFIRQDKPSKLQANRTELIYVESEVMAHCHDFFRIDRVNMPAYVMVLSKLDGHPESWSYFHHQNIVRNFRMQNGLTNTDFYSCLGNGPESNNSGVPCIRDMFFFVHYGQALVNAERLECVECKKNEPRPKNITYSNSNNYVPVVFEDANTTEVE